MWTILSLAAIGFVLRVGYRLYEGEASFWNTGYTFFWEMARSIAAGQGPMVARVPAYPAFLAAMTLGSRAFLPIVISQAAIGAGTVLGSALLATELFGSSAAVVAAGLTAVYPYYVVHDTALQETSLFTLLTLLSVLLLLWTWRAGSRRVAVYPAGEPLDNSRRLRPLLLTVVRDRRRCPGPRWRYRAPHAKGRPMPHHLDGSLTRLASRAATEQAGSTAPCPAVT